MEMENHCRICGMADFYPLDEEGYPTYAICDCCGSEAGYEDIDYSSARVRRQEWLDGGAKWWCKKTKPADWSYEKALEQLKNVPIEFK